MTNPRKEKLLASHRTSWSDFGVWLVFICLLLGCQITLPFTFRTNQVWVTLLLLVVTVHFMHAHFLAFHDAFIKLCALILL